MLLLMILCFLKLPISPHNRLFKRTINVTFMPAPPLNYQQHEIIISTTRTWIKSYLRLKVQCQRPSTAENLKLQSCTTIRFYKYTHTVVHVQLTHTYILTSTRHDEQMKKRTHAQTLIRDGGSGLFTP